MRHGEWLVGEENGVWSGSDAGRDRIVIIAVKFWVL